MSVKKELALSIVSFLKSEVENESLNADGIEGLEGKDFFVELYVFSLNLFGNT